MKRIGVLITIGFLASSLVYLFKPPPTAQVPSTASPAISKQSRETLNLNTASPEELESLPGIGPVMAARIVAYRNKNGSFARPEDLMIIEGMGEKKYRALADLIRVE
jgi:competence protein ComEA